MQVSLKIKNMQCVSISSWFCTILILFGIFYLTEDIIHCVLQKITHFQGSSVEVSADMMISNQHTLHNNWDEMSANLQRPPLPPIPLHQFFKSCGTGPYGRRRITGASKDVEQLVSLKFAAWQQQRAASGTIASASSDVVDQLGAVQARKRRASMEKAREMAEQKLSEQKQRRTVKLDAV